MGNNKQWATYDQKGHRHQTEYYYRIKETCVF